MFTITELTKLHDLVTADYEILCDQRQFPECQNAVHERKIRQADRLLHKATELKKRKEQEQLDYDIVEVKEDILENILENKELKKYLNEKVEGHLDFVFGNTFDQLPEEAQDELRCQLQVRYYNEFIRSLML